MSLQPRILIVDDEPLIHRVLRAALEAAGYEPLRAETGAEGLREMARAAPAAVVLDLGRPDMDGKAVLTKAREFYQEPILVLSARDKETEKIEALDLGANDYVEKPFGVGELLARLRASLRQRSNAARPPPPVVRAGEVVIDFPAGWSPGGACRCGFPRANTTCSPSSPRTPARCCSTRSCSPPSGGRRTCTTPST